MAKTTKSNQTTKNNIVDEVKKEQEKQIQKEQEEIRKIVERTIAKH